MCVLGLFDIWEISRNTSDAVVAVRGAIAGLGWGFDVCRPIDFAATESGHNFAVSTAETGGKRCLF